jgi:superfamily II DNA or RNA helicase
MSKSYSYPDLDDPDFLSSIFKKREFYYHKIEQRNKLESYEEIKNYRDKNCTIDQIPKQQQIILPTFINPNTPYTGIIVMHGVGTGKTMAAIQIAEQFKEQVKKYNTKIYVLVPGPNTRENFRKELISSTGNTYLKTPEILEQMSKEDAEHERRIAINHAMNYYKIMSHKTFHKRVLGEKIVEKKVVGNKKIKVTYKRKESGEYEREQVIDRITNMNNSILIIDEAHNITGNEYGEALNIIIKNSENLRIILLTATPMINHADEIIDLLNFIRPENDKIQRDKIFTSDKSYLMKIKPNGLNYLKEKAKGYISYYRGSIPYTFALRIDKGKIPNGLLFTPVIKCYMEKFQRSVYDRAIENFEDTLDKASSAASNFIFPALSKDKKTLIGNYSNEGLNITLSQLSTDGPILKKLINEILFNNTIDEKEEENLIYDNGKKNITGLILKIPHIRKLSIKFYVILNNLKKLFATKKSKSSTGFIYSNLVKAGGIELFAETMIQNGYLEYNQNFNDYDIKESTIDYRTGLTFVEFKKEGYKIADFKPATFLLVTGGTDKDDLAEYKQKIIRTVFNSTDNIDGKYIKFILGSRVMNEGVTLKNCKEIHILDVFYNIPKVEQAIGRVIRMCVHQDVITDDYKYPEVNVYKYVVAVDDKNNPNKLSNEELLYQKAELKYITIKHIERCLKEIAIDCPLLFHINMFPEEIEKYKDCVSPTLENVNSGKLICPDLCDFKKCHYKCDAPSINKSHWNNKLYTYNKLENNEIDYTTFNDKLASYEIDSIKSKIKDLFMFKHVYEYLEIVEYIQKSFTVHQQDLFNIYFVNKALSDIIPLDENDFNNFKDILYDKYNRPGYLIKRNKYYIFQPFSENENISMYYRETYDIPIKSFVSIKNYLKQYYPEFIKIKSKIKTELISKYNFDKIMDYYNSRNENNIVGIIDSHIDKHTNENIEIFKIRTKRQKDNKNKRAIGLPTLKGCVCTTYTDKSYLLKILMKISDEKYKENIKKETICNMIKEKLLHLEKYATNKDNNKLTYIMIPENHPIYPFPYNLEDRIEYIKNKIKEIDNTLDISCIKKKTSNGLSSYTLSFKTKKLLEKYYDKFLSYNFTLNNDIWSQIIE